MVYKHLAKDLAMQSKAKNKKKNTRVKSLKTSQAQNVELDSKYLIMNATQVFQT